MSDDLQPTNPPEEPSVLDYVKSLFRFGKEQKIQLPSFVEEESSIVEKETSTVDHQPETVQPSNLPTAFPWRSLLALVLALIGQKLIDSSILNVKLGGIFYVGAWAFLGW